MTKKQKAEMAIQYPEVRGWVLKYIRDATTTNIPYKPIDLCDGPDIPVISKEKVGSKEVNDWITNPKHLCNVDGAIALVNALLDRLS